MNAYSATGHYFTVNHLVLFTGLTDRTIRNYIAAGILQGEKINGLWHFSPEQVNAFFAHPAVRPSIIAKQNAAVYDFMLDRKKQEHHCCMILDLPGADPEAISEFFCQTISHSDIHDVHFSFDAFSGPPRVILSGRTADVTALVNRYYEDHH